MLQCGHCNGLILLLICYGVLLLELRCNNPDLAGDVGRIRDLSKVSYFVIFDKLKVTFCLQKLLDMLYDESITTTPPTSFSRGNQRIVLFSIL